MKKFFGRGFLLFVSVIFGLSCVILFSHKVSADGEDRAQLYLVIRSGFQQRGYSGFDTNLDEVTNDNASNFTGLFIEIPGAGKILFQTGLDLTNPRLYTFLQNTEEFDLYMVRGFARFIPGTGGSLSGMENILNVPAKFYLYLPNLPYVGSGVTSDIEISQFTPFPGLYETKYGTNLVSNVFCATGDLHNYCSFDVSGFIADTGYTTAFYFRPYFFSGNISSNNANTGIVTSGDTVTIRLSGYTELTTNNPNNHYSVSATINGNSGGINITWNTLMNGWTISKLFTGSSTTGISFDVQVTHAFGVGSNVYHFTGTTDGSSVSYSDIFAPTVPNLVAPSSGSSWNTGAISFSRTPSTDDMNVSGYLFQLSTGSDFATFITGKNIFTTGTTYTLSTVGTYYRRVKSFDTTGNSSDFSSIAVLYITGVVDILPPSVPTLLLPTSGTITTGGTISFTRSESTDNFMVSGYLFQLSTGSAFTTFITGKNIFATGTSYTINTTGTYYRRVRAFDAANNSGSFSSGFVLYITGYDASPNPVDFFSRTGAEPNMLYTSNIVTISGINTGIVVGVNTGFYRINGGFWIPYTSTGIASSGNTLQLALTSSVDFLSSKSMTVSYGNLSTGFSVTTRAMDTTPDTISFTSVSNSELSTAHTSNTGIVNGLDDGVFTASVTAGQLRKNGRLVIGSSTGVQNRDTLRITLTGSSAYSTPVSSTLSIGSGSYTYVITTKTQPSQGGGGGGGGNSTPTCINSNLICVHGIYLAKTGVDCQLGNLGKVCSISTGMNNTGVNNTGGNSTGNNNITHIGDISNSPFSNELNQAYLFAYTIGITTIPKITDANMKGTLIRKHLAKMISNFAIQELDLAPDTTKTCTFDDIANETSEFKYYIRLSCQLGLMGVGINSFSPNVSVTRAQFGTTLSRALFGATYDGGAPYYRNHLDALQTAGIMKLIDTPSMEELRGWVMLMLMRSVE